MASYERRKRQYAPLPERLQRLNREIAIERTKDFDYVYAVGQGLRFRVCVMRDVDGKCYATAQVGDRAFRRGGGTGPSGAFIMLVISVKIALAQMPSAKRAALQAAV